MLKSFNCMSRLGLYFVFLSVLALGWEAEHSVKADPVDDFSFMITRGSAAYGAYGTLSSGAIAQILVSKLDLFPNSQAPKLATHLVSLCKKYRFDPTFVLSLVKVESDFRVGVVSPSGAIGLMQLMPGTADFVAKRYAIPYHGERSLKDPYTNLSIGVAYLSYLRTKYKAFSPYVHIAAYNIGPAKLHELMSHKDFKPTATKAYYENIRKAVPTMRFYGSRELAGKASAAGYGRHGI